MQSLFAFDARQTTLRREVLGGVVTFLTMSYIVFVNPAILSSAGLPFDAVAVGTALAAAGFTIIMGLATNLPFALASGLGINAVVAFDIILGRRVSPDVGMACIVLEGAVAVVLVLAGLREAVVRAVPSSLKLAIGVGIGLFITLVGLRDGGIVVNDAATGIALGDLTSGPALIALAGILVALGLSAAGVRGSILLGIATSTVLGLVFGVLDGPSAVARWPTSDDFSTIGDGLSSSALGDALTWTLVPVIFSLFMTDFFDTVGTAYAVTSAGGLLDEKGEIPKVRNLLLVDSLAAAGGGAMGVSSVTTYVESGAGVAEGARTGFASVDHRVAVRLDDLLRALDRGRRPGRRGEQGHHHPPGDRAGAGHGGVLDDPARPGHRLGAARGRGPGVPGDHRDPADVLDLRRHRARRLRLRGRR